MDKREAEDRIYRLEPKGKGGRNPNGTNGATGSTAKRVNDYPESQSLMEAVLKYDNIKIAVQRVVGNKGAPRVDGMTTEQLKSYMSSDQWIQTGEKLLAGKYQPQPVRGVEIPKPDGKGVRQLGIPTVIDRLIQQALLQVLTSIFDGGFSESSYGFRPGRSAQQAVLKAKDYIAEGRTWVVDIDLEKFFDRVNHDILMSRIARKVQDKRVLLLIRRFLQAGLMMGGLSSIRREGTPQGGPLSPLLSNIILDDLDKELEQRGHAFCRYADDCNTYVHSEKAGKRVKESITQYLCNKLKLKVNEEKSAVGQAWERKFLGYTVSEEEKPRLKVAPSSIKRLKDKLRGMFRTGRGRELKEFIKGLKPILIGWANYFYLTGDKYVMEGLDKWIRRKLRKIIWIQLKHPVTRLKELIRRGVGMKGARQLAGTRKGPWRSACNPIIHKAYPNKYFEDMGLVSLHRRRERLMSL